jgi:RNA polymerase sigma-70 factor (family 1)
MKKDQLDNDLFSRFRKGDRRANQELYLVYHDAIFVFASRIVRNTEEADDITSDTFNKLWDQRKDFKNLSNIRAFLYLTCRNACFDYLRSLQSHKTSHKEILYLSKEGEMPGDPGVDETEVWKEIYQQVEKLPPRCGQVFRLIFFDGKKTREVAVQLGVTLATVQTHKSIAIKKLRDALLRKDLLSLPLLT